MKTTAKILTLLLLFIPMLTHAQITVLSTDMPVVGNKILRTRDSAAINVNIGSGGANKVWDFSNVTSAFHSTSVTHVVTPVSTTDASSFSTSNLAFTVDSLNYVYVLNSAATYLGKGYAGKIGTDHVVTVLNPDLTTYTFPITYNTHHSDTYGFDQAVSGASVGQPTVYQVRDIHKSVYKDTVDGWGIVKTPIGTYNCLRIHSVDCQRDSLFYKLLSIFPWTYLSTTVKQPVSYSWISKETKLPVVDITFDSLQQPIVVYSNIQAIPIASFTDTVNASGLGTFTNTSINGPNTYSWNFGDGAVSTATNPTHQFTSSGSFIVCLIVTNPSGSDTVCQTVNVIYTGMAETENTLKGFNAWPNPFTQNVSLLIESTKEDVAQLRVLDISGRMVSMIEHAKTNQTFSIDLPLSKGIYFIEATLSDSVKRIIKIVKTE